MNDLGSSTLLKTMTSWVVHDKVIKSVLIKVRAASKKLQRLNSSFREVLTTSTALLLQKMKLHCSYGRPRA